MTALGIAGGKMMLAFDVTLLFARGQKAQPSGHARHECPGLGSLGEMLTQENGYLLL